MIRLLVLGDPNVGKTSFISRLCNKSFCEKYIPTQGNTNSCMYNVSGLEHKSINIGTSNGQKIKFQIFDTSGKDESNPSLDIYYQKATAFLLLFSLSDNSSFQNINKWISHIEKNQGANSFVVLVGTKSDLKEREVTIEEINDLKAKYNIPYYEISSKDTTNKHDEILQEISNNVQASVNNSISDDSANSNGTCKV